MKLGAFVCPVDDDKAENIAVVVYDHSVTGYPGMNTVKWMDDGLISTRDDEDLRELTPLEFCKVWCKNQIGY